MIKTCSDILQSIGGFIAYTVAQNPLIALGYVMLAMDIIIMAIIILQLHKIHKKEKRRKWQ